ncbi:hypothetical protein AG1IA_01037 [Rhizoctonia solani AG-1 IA]|uniref:Uncharacterized protein n=1 Tax=Thanatephorus cucumeris (strain AG1-IA) TaxID=983506 RepID=L8X3Q3_THACA|nr:hypothetical protein AG1IA_01037 [Rhizoctonia solani AG-1 IA]
MDLAGDDHETLGSCERQETVPCALDEGTAGECDVEEEFGVGFARERPETRSGSSGRNNSPKAGTLYDGAPVGARNGERVGRIPDERAVRDHRSKIDVRPLTGAVGPRNGRECKRALGVLEAIFKRVEGGGDRAGGEYNAVARISQGKTCPLYARYRRVAARLSGSKSNSYSGSVVGRQLRTLAVLRFGLTSTLSRRSSGCLSCSLIYLSIQTFCTSSYRLIKLFALGRPVSSGEITLECMLGSSSVQAPVYKSWYGRRHVSLKEYNNRLRRSSKVPKQTALHSCVATARVIGVFGSFSSVHFNLGYSVGLGCFRNTTIPLHTNDEISEEIGKFCIRGTRIHRRMYRFMLVCQYHEVIPVDASAYRQLPAPLGSASKTPPSADPATVLAGLTGEKTCSCSP